MLPQLLRSSQKTRLWWRRTEFIAVVDIEKRYAETFQRSHIIDFDSRREHHESTTRFGRTGGGAVLFESQSGTAFASGYWSAIYVREGNVWKIRMLSIIERPATTFEKK
jgi:hypothetical protein